MTEIRELTAEHVLVDAGVDHVRLAPDSLPIWAQGRAPIPDLILCRTESVDRQDLMNTGDASGVAVETQLLVDESFGWSDCLGIPQDGLERRPPPSIPFIVGLELTLARSPFGECQLSYTLSNGAIAPGIPAHGSPSMTVSLAYDDALDWVHGSRTLVHLFRDAQMVNGSISTLSTVEGTVRAPGPRLKGSATSILKAYSRFRCAHREATRFRASKVPVSRPAWMHGTSGKPLAGG